MNARSINSLLLFLTVALCAGAGLVLTAGFMLPLQKADELRLPDQKAKEISPTESLPPVSTFTPIFARSLQTHQAVVASAIVPDSVPAQGLASISQLVLVGTIGDGLALIRGPDGTIGLVETGEDVNGSPVVAIRQSQIDLRVNGKITTLKMSPPPDDSAVLHAR